jgi:hypothetical protein
VPDIYYSDFIRFVISLVPTQQRPYRKAYKRLQKFDGKTSPSGYVEGMEGRHVAALLR